MPSMKCTHLHGGLQIPSRAGRPLRQSCRRSRAGAASSRRRTLAFSASALETRGLIAVLWKLLLRARASADKLRVPATGAIPARKLGVRSSAGDGRGCGRSTSGGDLCRRVPRESVLSVSSSASTFPEASTSAFASAAWGRLLRGG
eukprot:scaffold75191_cov48-Phaeocystis_antarctica.AAC.1